VVTHVVLCGPANPNELFSSQKTQLFLGLSGATVLTELAKGLVNLGIFVTVVTTSDSVDKVWIRSNGLCKVYVLPHRKRAREKALDFFKAERDQIKRLINELDCDIVHAHWTYEFALGALSSNKTVLVTAHDSPFTVFRHMPDAYRFFRLLLAWIVRLKTLNLSAVSNKTKQKWQRQMLWKKPIEIIPNSSSFVSKSKIHIKSNATKVLAITEDNKIKNVETLILAWTLVLKVMPNATLDLVGHGLAKGDRLEKWATEYGYNKSIHWHGFLDKTSVLKSISDTDILVQPSREESFGLTLIEAMGLGIPVIGGLKSGAVPETIGEAGLLININNPFEIADTIILLLRNPEFREKLGKTGKLRVKHNFSRKHVTDKYVSLYKKILETKNV